MERGASSMSLQPLLRPCLLMRGLSGNRRGRRGSSSSRVLFLASCWRRRVRDLYLPRGSLLPSLLPPTLRPWAGLLFLLPLLMLQSPLRSRQGLSKGCRVIRVSPRVMLLALLSLSHFTCSLNPKLSRQRVFTLLYLLALLGLLSEFVLSFVIAEKESREAQLV